MNKFYCLVTILLLSLGTGFAQYGWSHLGPLGGDVRVFTSDSLFVYAGTAGGGIYKTSNQGESWIYLGLNSATVRSILPMPNGDMYAGTDYGLFKKQAAGTFFSRVTQFTNIPIWSLAIKGTDIFVGTGSLGLYRSTDNGSTWVGAAMSTSTIRCITLAPNGDIYFGTGGQGIFKSTNSGNTWAPVGLSSYMVRTIKFAPNGSIFAGTYGGIFKSTNDGTAWNSVGLTQTDIPDISIKPNGHLFAATWEGVYKSTDNGTNWVLNGFSESITWSVFTDKFSNTYIGRDGEGVFRTSDNGTTWTENNNGILASRVWAINFDNIGRIYAGVSGGAFKSTDNGQTFTRIINSTLAGRVWSFLVINDNDVLAGTSKGVFRTTNQGTTWTQLGIPTESVKALKRNSLGYIFAATSNGFYRSLDNGSTWTLHIGGFSSTSLYDLEVTSNNTIFAAAGGGSAVYKSTNHGLSWTAANTGISGTSASDLFIDTRGFLYACAGSTVYKSINNGGNWTNYGGGFTSVSSIYVDSLAHSFQGNLGDGIYYMPDTSYGWLLANVGPENLYIYAITGDKSGYIYAATVGGSIYKSINSYIPVELVSFECRVKESKIYLTWKTESELNNKGFYLERRSLNGWEEIAFIIGSGTTTEKNNYYYDDINLDPGKYLYRLKQVDYDGKYKYSKIISAEVLPTGFKLMQNYPNPFNPFTVIKFSVPEEQKVQLVVYDFLGNEIRELFNGSAEAKRLYEVEFTSEGLSSGIYYYKLTAGDRTEIKKMILMK